MCFGNEEETSLIQVHGDLGVFLEGIWVRGEETEEAVVCHGDSCRPCLRVGGYFSVVEVEIR